MPTHKVLIPLDGSHFSWQILTVVGRLLSPEQYAVVLVRVEDEPVLVAPLPPRAHAAVGTLGPLYAAELEGALERYETELDCYAQQADLIEQSVRLEDEADLCRAAQLLPGFDVSLAVRFGAPADEIVHVAEHEHVDLIAMATHGRTGMRRMLMGSVAEEVLHRAEVPVLLLRSVVENRS